MEKNKMPLEQRAKQFMPFSALSGLDAALKAKEREMGLTDKPSLSEEREDEINALLLGLEAGDRVIIDYFRNGESVSVEGEIERIGCSEIVVKGVFVKIKDVLAVRLVHKSY